MTVLEPVIGFVVDRQRGVFTLNQVLAKVGRPRRPVMRVLDKLCAEGYLTEIDNRPLDLRSGEYGPPRRNPVWRINRDKPVLTRPRVKIPRRTKRDKMWQIIRARRRFTRTDLEVLCGVGRGSAENYTKLLERACHIRKIGKNGRETLWLLIRDCGPTRPIIPEEMETAANKTPLDPPLSGGKVEKQEVEP